jgi:hypothetical protein
MTIPFSGGCACGAIRYECTAEPFAMFRCHCRDCQRATGGPSAFVVYVPAKAFKVTQGVLRHFHTPSLAGGHNKRGYCADCGSPISGAETERGIGIHAASLDDPSLFEPTMDIHVADAQRWDIMDPKTLKFEQYPPRGERQ